MGSPITFSGFNNIDFSVVLSAIMQQERQPIAAMETQRTALKAQNSAFATFATKLAALQSAAEAFTDEDRLSSVKATTSDDSVVGISSGSATATGSYQVVVSELAKAQVSKSSTTYSSRDAVVATSGAISLAQFGNPPVNITVDGSMSVEDIADAINSSAEAPVSAAVVQVAPGEYRLVLTGRSTGSANSFTVGFPTALSGGEGLAFVGPNAQTADDAELSVNQVAITSASNSLDDVIPGVTLQLRKTSATPVTVDVAKNTEAAVTQVNTFVAAYNDVVKFIADQTTAQADGKNSISRDSLVRGLRDALRSSVLGAESSGTFTRLAEVGIGFDATGKMKVDSDRFTTALETSQAGVRALFAGTNGTGGRFRNLESMIESYTRAGGLVADARERIDQQVSRIGTRIDSLEAQLAVRRAALQQEFIAADRAMSQLSNQGSSLSALSGQYRLF